MTEIGIVKEEINALREKIKYLGSKLQEIRGYL